MRDAAKLPTDKILTPEAEAAQKNAQNETKNGPFLENNSQLSCFV